MAAGFYICRNRIHAFRFAGKAKNLAVSTGLVDALIVVISILIGIFILKDAVTIPQAAGLALAFLAVAFLMF